MLLGMRRKRSEDMNFKHVISNLEKNETVFKELRDALKIAMPGGKESFIQPQRTRYW
jgi:hypothetical protein